jgi:glycosyltransferase involved in cell wall biosynthesis
LFSQLHKNIQLRVEVVVVDDASTDNTAMKVAGFVEERRQKGITNPEYDILQVPITFTLFGSQLGVLTS